MLHHRPRCKPGGFPHILAKLRANSPAELLSVPSEPCEPVQNIWGILPNHMLSQFPDPGERPRESSFRGLSLKIYNIQDSLISNSEQERWRLLTS